MKRLFNSRGEHTANESGGRLYAPSGPNIGRYIDGAEIFVDLSGRYLGDECVKKEIRSKVAPHGYEIKQSK